MAVEHSVFLKDMRPTMLLAIGTWVVKSGLRHELDLNGGRVFFPAEMANEVINGISQIAAGHDVKPLEKTNAR